MKYLTFEQIGTGNTYTIKNTSQDIIGFIGKSRTGQFIHYCLQIPLELMKECVEQESGLIFSPGCMDEIRAFCKKLNGNMLKDGKNKD